MTWISKDLTLDLLAIGIHARQKTFDRIKEEPAAPEPKPEPQEEETPDLLPEAQNTLRAISMDEGPGWITGTLFPHFNVQSLTDVPADKLPELITMAQKHRKGD